MKSVILKRPHENLRRTTNSKVNLLDLVVYEKQFYVAVVAVTIDSLDLVHDKKLVRLKSIPYDRIETDFGTIYNYPEDATGEMVAYSFKWWDAGKICWAHRVNVEELMRQEFTRIFMDRAEQVFG